MLKIVKRQGGARSGSRIAARAVLALAGWSAVLVLSGCAIGARSGAADGWFGIPPPPDQQPAAGMPVPGPAAVPPGAPAQATPPSAAASSTDPKVYLATFTTRLAGVNEVPINTSMGTGTVDALLDQRSGLLRWKMSFDNLSGPATMAHFHGPAPIGISAGVAMPFAMPITSPYEGRVTLDPQQMADLLAGKWYANVHTAKYPNGELRGQMIERK